MASHRKTAFGIGALLTMSVLPIAAAQAEVACEDLTGLDLRRVQIVSATSVPAGTLPAHCDVRGTIKKGGGNIKFALLLPEDWNGRFHMSGNGGKAGTISLGAAQSAMALGYAATSTDTGHNLVDDGPGAQFGDDREKEIDFGWRAVHETVKTAKGLISTFYGQKPLYSYWQGCSTGGRQGLREMQMFPKDFDGIIAGAPVYDYMTQQMTAPAFMRALYQVDPIAESSLITLADATALRDAIYAKCDGLDGLVDGQIRDPRLCKFNHRNSSDFAGFSDQNHQKLKALDRLYGGLYNSYGELIIPGMVKGSEGMSGGWSSWLLSNEGASPALHTVMIDAFNWLVFKKDEPDYVYMTDFDFETDPPKTRFMAKILSATDPDVSVFRKHGGKIITYHGWADAGVNPLGTIEYRDNVIRSIQGELQLSKKEATEEADNFLKLYMIPGMGHCSGGVGHDQVDFLSALVQWVENGTEPGALIGAKSSNPADTRLHCPYPRVAAYKGAPLDPADAGSFVCRNPPR
jgi:hypothetical protein